jgi:DNA (cytosine-5)-methyltransferase 1
MIKQPAPSEIKRARLDAGITQSQAAHLVHVKLKTWQNWEAESGPSMRVMPRAAWELFCIKIQQSNL